MDWILYNRSVHDGNRKSQPLQPHTETPAMSASSPNSTGLYDRAQKVLAGGVSHEGRYTSVTPKYVDRAAGSRKTDVEGREYIDYAMGSASLLLGHAHPEVVRAITEQAERGTFYADCHPLEVDWGERVCKLVPCADQVRFVGSGTEATMLAIRIGRAYSGRPTLLRFEGHYHGWHDYALLGSKAPYDEAPSLGIPPGALDATVVAPTDAARVDEMLAADPNIGTIICEASGANYGSVPVDRNFLLDLREIATRRDCVLIFDEVITGFRWSPGGRQARDEVTPDLSSLAKILTGGMPGGAVVGREEIMRMIDPSHEHRGFKPAVTHKGTFNGSPLVAAGAVAAMKEVATGDHQRRADAAAARLRGGIRSILETHQVRGAVYGESSTFHVFFGETDDQGGVAGLAPDRIRGLPKPVVDGLRLELRDRGVDLMSYTGGVTSSAHSDEDIDQTLTAYEGAIQALVADGRLPC